MRDGKASLFKELMALPGSKRRIQRMEELAVNMGFSNREDAMKHIKPYIPPGIYDISRFFGLFTSDEVFWQLRPMLYVFWG